MMHEDRHRAGSFGEDAEQYDRARPSYPAELVDDLLAPGIHRVLDVGCGTGIAARLFAARGAAVLGVEPDPRMAAVARHHGIDVVVARFEAWEPPPAAFDLVISAQAWHWVDPDAGAVRSAAALRPGGRLAAFWNSYTPAPEVRAALDEVYQRAPPAPAGAPNDDVRIRALEVSGLFEPVERRSYPWRRTYDRDEWLDQLPTHSNIRVMDPAARRALLTAVGAVIDRFGGRITVDHSTRLITARRRISE